MCRFHNVLVIFHDRCRLADQQISHFPASYQSADCRFARLSRTRESPGRREMQTGLAIDDQSPEIVSLTGISRYPETRSRRAQSRELRLRFTRKAEYNVSPVLLRPVVRIQVSQHRGDGGRVRDDRRAAPLRLNIAVHLSIFCVPDGCNQLFKEPATADSVLVENTNGTPDHDHMAMRVSPIRFNALTGSLPATLHVA